MMKSLALAAALLGSASAFAPQYASTKATSLNAMPDRMWEKMVDPNERSRACPWLPRAINLDGSLPGDQGFDPFYLSSINVDFSGFIQPLEWEDRKLSTIYWMREAEVKHARVAMLAWFGWLATDGAFGFPLRFPGEIYQNIPSAYEAHDILVKQGSMSFMLVIVGLIELCTGAVLVEVSKGVNDREAGDFGLDPLKFLKGKSAEEIMDWKTKEINNGRLAMLAFGGVATQAALGDATHNFPYF